MSEESVMDRIRRHNEIIKARMAGAIGPKPVELTEKQRARMRKQSRIFRSKNPDYARNYYQTVVKPRNDHERHIKQLSQMTDEELLTEMRRRNLC